MNDQDDGANVALWAVLGIITLLLFGLIGGLALRSLNAKKAPAPAALAATAAAAGAADEMVELPLSGVMVVRLLFDLDQAALQPDTPAMLALAVKALADAPGKKLVIAGFHDPSGDAAHNADLAKRRAIAVRLALVAQGADGTAAAAQAEQTELGGPPEEARRVEVRLID
jgi:outer membrane protein OmpA-like peptidoglycan-associated protein